MATNWKEYTTKTNPEDTDEIMIADTKANANKRTPLSGLWNWIAGKLATAVISQLETQNKSIIPALNELNSNISSTKNISDFDSKYSSGKLRILYGVINNVGYISFDMFWTRIQFKVQLGVVAVRPVYGESPIGEWTQIK